MTETLCLLSDLLPTPIGELMVVADEQGRLRGAEWLDHQARLMHLLTLQNRKRRPALRPARDPAGLTSAFAAYFAGDLAAIDGLPVATGGTPFQQAVWRALRDIPHGRTVAYRTLAERVGRPSAVRAVGHANGSNPISVAVPCHRVIGANGGLTGYGGGVARKRWLLRHEGVEI